MDEILKELLIKKINPGAYSGSTWQSAHEAEQVFASINPTTGSPIASVMSSSLEDYAEVLARARAAFLVWKNTPAPVRGDIIRQMGLILREYKTQLAHLISLEMGKSYQESAGEVQEMIDMADFAVGQSRMLYGKTMHSERPMHRMYEQWHPLGIVGVISAFNFPVAVWAWNAFIGAICGNVTLWKPSSKTPLCAIAVHHLCAKILKKNQIPDIFSLIISNHHAIAEALIDEVHIPLISFTGSTRVGKTVASRVASRLGRTILELGGNNAILLDETSPLDLAIAAIVFGAVGTAGQRCTTTRRLFIHEHQYEPVLTALKEAYSQIRIGSPLDVNHHMGPLIDEAAVLTFQKTIARIQRDGGEVVYGGGVIAGPGFFVEPTIIRGLAHDSPIVHEEVFAPILYVISYTTFEEAISYQNEVPQGLSSALFTQNLYHAETFLSANGSDCGIANINIGTTGAEIGGAFGGEKETGGGREAGSDAWKAYMRRQTNTINWGHALPLAQGIVFDVKNKEG